MGVCGCGTGSVREDAIVADVGERTVALREITDYLTGVGIDYPAASDEYVARRRRLKDLIEDELLIIGAYDRALDADIGILELVEAEKDKFILDELYRVEVIDKATVSEAEIRDAYDRAFDRIRLSHILLESEEVADSVMAALDAGGDFADLAQDFSLDESSRLRGGDMGRELKSGELPPELEEKAFAMAEGEVAGPIATAIGWHIIKVTGKSQAERHSYEDMKATLEGRLKRRKQNARRVEHLDGLKEQFDPRFDEETIALWRSKLSAIADTADLPAGQSAIVPPEQLGDDEKELVVYRWGDDRFVTLEQFCRALRTRSPYEQPDPDDPESMKMTAFSNSLFDVLHAEALRLGLDQTDIFRDRVREYQESLMAERMRTQVLVRGVRVTEEEVAALYRAKRDSFADPAQYHVRELIVYDSTQIENLMQQVQRGTSLESLARVHTKRPGMAKEGGDLGWLRPYTYPDYYKIAETMDVGEVYGPVIAADQYSIIELIDKRPPVLRELDEVKGVVFERLQADKRNELISRYFDSLQVHHPVTIHNDVLESGLGDVSTTRDSLGMEWWRP
jgi:parvulin-like peptidyl-prolyl isomerase